jgi:DNA-binding IclR family transcriptional regulator
VTSAREDRDSRDGVDLPALRAEILDALDGHTACSSELAAHLGRAWQLVWDAIHALKDRGLVQLDCLRGRWELTAKARFIRAVVARAVEANPTGPSK